MTEEGKVLTFWLLLLFVAGIMIYPLYKSIEHLESIRMHLEMSADVEDLPANLLRQSMYDDSN